MPITRPPIIQKPFSESGNKTTIPLTTTDPGAASWAAGFPPDTMLDIGDGGIAPDGLDMNGILNIITQHIRFMLAGGYPRFDATLCTEIGGYPVGTILQDNGGVNLYRNVLANNTTNFNTTPASIGTSWIWLTGQTRSIVAGNGLTGGGVPATADVTLHVGTPATCSSTSTNAATADTHSHALTLPDPGAVTAGNGLTGGGDLPGELTLHMGTPATCSTTSTNAVTADSHSHALTLPDPGSVAAGNGLTGGGDLPGALTLNMGTPGTISLTSSNAVSADSHTHVLSIPSANGSVVGITRYAVGTEASDMLLNNVALTPGGLGLLMDEFFGKRSYTASDQIRIPDVSGGWNIKWGKVTGVSGAKTVTFPASFEHACLNVGATLINGGAENSTTFVSCTAVTNGNATFYVDAEVGTVGFYWFAIGY